MCALNELLWQLIDGDLCVCGWLLWIQDDKNATKQMWVCLKWIVRYILPKKIIRGLEPAIDELSDIYYQRKLEGEWSQPLMTSRLRNDCEIFYITEMVYVAQPLACSILIRAWLPRNTKKWSCRPSLRLLFHDSILN